MGTSGNLVDLVYSRWNNYTELKWTSAVDAASTVATRRKCDASDSSWRSCKWLTTEYYKSSRFRRNGRWIWHGWNGNGHGRHGYGDGRDVRPWHVRWRYGNEPIWQWIIFGKGVDVHVLTLWNCLDGWIQCWGTCWLLCHVAEDKCSDCKVWQGVCCRITRSIYHCLPTTTHTWTAASFILTRSGFTKDRLW